VELFSESELEEMEDPDSDEEMAGNLNLDCFPVEEEINF